MKILQVGKFYYPYKGGMETYLYDLCQGLKDKVDLKVLVSNTSFRTLREEVAGVDVIRAGRWFSFASTSISFSFPFYLKSNAADIIQIGHPDPMAGLAYLLTRPSGKLAVMYHSDIVKQKVTYVLYYPFVISLLKKADAVIVTSPQYLESSVILRRFEDKCRVIPIGIDLTRFVKTPFMLKRMKSIRDRFGERIILFIGRLSLYKGVEYLIEAMENVRGTLLIIGTGERFEILRAIVLRKSLDKKIIFLGEVPQNDLPAYLHTSSIFCLPSVARNEAFGICQLEAMACGKPVVSTRLNTGVTYINRDEETGILVPPRRSDALAAALNKLLDSPDLARRMGSKGRLRVEELFTREKMVKSTLRLYEELLSQG